MDIKYKVALIYFAVISVISAVVCIADKKRAKKGKYRIRERTLFLLSFLGGGAAMYLTMQIIRHKTKHKRFMIGIPLIIILHIVLIILKINSFGFPHFPLLKVLKNLLISEILMMKN